MDIPEQTLTFSQVEMALYSRKGIPLMGPKSCNRRLICFGVCDWIILCMKSVLLPYH